MQPDETYVWVEPMNTDSASFFLSNHTTKIHPARIFEIAEIQIRVLHRQHCNNKKQTKNSVAFTPRANYTDRGTATYRRS
jgi:hypothetical protein